MHKVHIIDYGLGNLFSVKSAIEKIGATPIITNIPDDLMEADFVILPGVGAFQKGMHLLTECGFKTPILEYVKKGKPLLGICLGMQMLFESSEENGTSKGLGLLPGHVEKITEGSVGVKVPHIGWSQLRSINDRLKDFVENKHMYFVHSYHPVTEESYYVAKTNYHGIEITAIVKKDNVWGCQFHPEKSGEDGLNLLKEIINFS